MGVQLSKGINIAMQRVSPLLDYNPFMRFCAKFLLINPEQYPLKNVWEKLFYLFYYVFFNYLTKSIIVIWFINQFNKFSIKRAFANKQMHQLYLKKKYSHIKFEYDQCPFNNLSSWTQNFKSVLIWRIFLTKTCRFEHTYFDWLKYDR